MGPTTGTENGAVAVTGAETGDGIAGAEIGARAVNIKFDGQ